MGCVVRDIFVVGGLGISFGFLFFVTCVLTDMVHDSFGQSHESRPRLSWDMVFKKRKTGIGILQTVDWVNMERIDTIYFA